MIRRSVLVVALLFATACRRGPENDPRLVSVWNKTLYGATRVERLSPPVASRLMVYATTALYSGFAAADSKLEPITALNGMPSLPRAGVKGPAGAAEIDGTITAVTAERVVLDSLLREALPTTLAAVARLADSLDQARTALLKPGVADRSREMGRAIGLGIVAWSRADGFDSTRGRPYTPPKGEGLWVNDAPAPILASQNLSGASEFVATDNPANVLQPGNASDRGLVLNRPKRKNATLPPVNMAGASEPYWYQVRPFALRSWNECPLEPPPAYSVDTTSALYKSAREVYETRRSITPEQRTVALYWADNAGESGTPVGHWLAIANQVANQRHLSAEAAARLMVVTAVAQADAFIATWGYKYQFNLIRPRTYIRRVIDPQWEPLIPTPPFPEYPSGHSAQSSAAATAINAVLGEGAFDDSTSITIGHSVRRFETFTDAAQEAGQSRVYGGIHFPFGNLGGRTLGACIGEKVVERVGKGSK